MSIILKFILKNIKEKKLRTFLIVISIMASTALFFAANGIASTLKETQINIAKSVFGNAEIMITPGQESPSPYFSSNKAELYRDRLDYIVEEMNINAQYTYNRDEIVPLQLTGIDYNDLSIMNPLQIIDSSTIKPFQGNKIIISKKSADKYNINIGDKLKLNINNNNENFTVIGIVQSQGIFKIEDNKTIIGVIPKSTAQQLNDARGMASTIYLKTKNPSDTDNLINQISNSYKNYNVKPTINIDEINENTKSTSTTFLAMLIIVLTMSVFIIYTVFKVIIIERLPIIGTFRSIGATKFMTDSVLIVESLIYGIIGGITGIAVGIGIVKLAAIGLSMQIGTITINYNINQIFMAFGFAVIVSVFSAIVPIARVSRLSVKDVVLNTVDTAKRKKLWKLIIAIVLILTAMIFPRLSSLGSTAIMLDLIGMIFGTIGIVMIVPYFTDLFVVVLEKIYALVFRNEGILAAKNLRNNKNILNNISLLTIGISALFMLNVVSFSLGKELVKAYEISKCDIFISNSGGGILNGDVLSRVRSTEGVSQAAGMYSAFSTKVQGTNNTIMGIYGYNPKYFNNFMDVNFLQNEDGIIKNLYDNREIAITESVRQSLNVSIGDIITLKTANGDRSYKISGTFSTLMDNGSMAIISEKYLKQDFKLSQYASIFATTNKSPDEVAEYLNKQFKGKQIQAISWKSMEEENARQINQMLMIIKVFPVVSLIIGAFGVLNNFIISFMERRRQLAVFASVGMSKFQTVKMLFIEALSAGIIGAVMGVFGGLISTYIMPYVLKAVNFPMPIHYETQIFITCLILGMVITLISSIVPALKSSKLNIIEAIKYE